jgi:hypothetical protein
MTDTTLTTTVTFADLIAHYDDELDDLREAYDDVLDAIREEFGADAIDEAVPEDPDDDDRQYLRGLQQTANLFSESAKSIQKRQHVLERLREDYSGDSFTIKMLTGGELADLETELRMEAHRKDVPVETLQAERQRRLADTGTIGAPPEVCDDDGTPEPSAAPNALALTLAEVIQELNQQGGLDFTPQGFGDPIGTGSPSSATPTGSAPSSSDSDSTAEPTPDSGGS